MRKPLTIILFCSLYIIAFLIYLLFSKQKRLETIITPKLINLIDITNVDQVSWLSDEDLLYSSGKVLFSYNLKSRESIKVNEYKNNFVFAETYIPPIIVCEWFNTEISDKNEFATTIIISNLSDSLQQKIIKLHNTTMPTVCSTSKIMLETSVPILEKKYYSLSLETEIPTEIQQSEYSKNHKIFILSQNGITVIKNENKEYKIDTNNVFTSASISPKGDIAMIDINKRLWIYATSGLHY